MDNLKSTGSAGVRGGAARLRTTAALVLMLGGATVIGGCSPYSFGDEISKFEKATSALTGAATAAAEKIDLAAKERTYWAIYERPDKVELDPLNCSDITTPVCTLNGSTFDGEIVSDVPKAKDAALKESLAKFANLQAYAGALKAVTAAEDRQAFDKAVSELSRTVGGMAALAPQGAVAGPVLAATVRAVGFAAGTLQDYRRRRVLEKAVVGVNPAVQGAEPALQEALTEVLRTQYDSVYDRGTDLRRALRNTNDLSERRRLMDALFETSAELRGLQAAKPAKAVTAFAKAHDALTKAVIEGNTADFLATIKLIETFATEAQALKSALATARDAN